MFKKNEDERFGWDFDRDKVTCFTCSLFSFILHTTQRHAQDRGSCKYECRRTLVGRKKGLSQQVHGGSLRAALVFCS